MRTQVLTIVALLALYAPIAAAQSTTSTPDRFDCAPQAVRRQDRFPPRPVGAGILRRLQRRRHSDPVPGTSEDHVVRRRRGTENRFRD